MQAQMERIDGIFLFDGCGLIRRRLNLSRRIISTVLLKGVMKYLAILLLTVAGSVNAASFNCDKAATLVEKAICSHNNLSKLDDVLSANYTDMMASNIGEGAKKDLRATQRNWLTTRNKCATVQCVEILYHQRIDAVCEYPVVSGVHPACVSSDDALLASGAPPQNQVQKKPKENKTGSSEYILYMAIFDKNLQPTNTYISKDECEENGKKSVAHFKQEFIQKGGNQISNNIIYKCDPIFK